LEKLWPNEQKGPQQVAPFLVLQSEGQPHRLFKAAETLPFPDFDGLNRQDQISQTGGSLMRGPQLIQRQTRARFQVDRYPENFTEAEARNRATCIVEEFPMLSDIGAAPSGPNCPCGTKGFFRDFPAAARSDFELLATYFHCPGSTVLISESQLPSSILFLLEGKVNISMNSSGGRRFVLGAVSPGDTLGLNSAVSGDASEIRAEAVFPCRIASLQRRDFLDFLSRHPIASQNVARELSQDYSRACVRLRILGLTSTTTGRLALLLLEWCRGGQETEIGIQIRCALTHQEIGEYIAASRETVTRTLADFKSHDLVRLRGTTLVVTSRQALAVYAGIDSLPDRHDLAE
jgi:CRP/FNR family cyclic AMP-dependent transcriptional regulator